MRCTCNRTSRDLNFLLPLLNPKSWQKPKSLQTNKFLPYSNNFLLNSSQKSSQKNSSQKNPPKRSSQKTPPKNFSQKIPLKKFRPKSPPKTILSKNSKKNQKEIITNIALGGRNPFRACFTFHFSIITVVWGYLNICKTLYLSFAEFIHLVAGRWPVLDKCKGLLFFVLW